MGLKMLFYVKDLAVTVLQKQEKLITKLKVVSTSEESESNVSSEIQSAIQTTEKATCLSNLDNSYALLNESPLAPLYSISKHQKIKVCKSKLGKVKRKLTFQLAVVFGLLPGELDTDMSGKQGVSELKNNNKKLQEQSSEVNCLIPKIKS